MRQEIIDLPSHGPSNGLIPTKYKKLCTTEKWGPLNPFLWSPHVQFIGNLEKGTMKAERCLYNPTLSWSWRRILHIVQVAFSQWCDNVGLQTTKGFVSIQGLVSIIVFLRTQEISQIIWCLVIILECLVPIMGQFNNEIPVFLSPNVLSCYIFRKTDKRHSYTKIWTRNATRTPFNNIPYFYFLKSSPRATVCESLKKQHEKRPVIFMTHI